MFQGIDYNHDPWLIAFQRDEFRMRNNVALLIITLSFICKLSTIVYDQLGWCQIHFEVYQLPQGFKTHLNIRGSMDATLMSRKLNNVKWKVTWAFSDQWCRGIYTYASHTKRRQI